MGDIPPTNIVRQGQASQTALRVATARAVHQLLDDPILFEDPLALRILGPATEQSLREDPFAHNEPIDRGMRAGVVVRAKFIEEELARAVGAGVQQYVVLGAGLDTFAYRNPHPALRVFEVDHPSTQEWKRRMLAEAAIPVPGSLTLVPVDFEHGALVQCLAGAGFRADQPACICWMGVTMYLTEAAIMETLGYVARLPNGSSIAFDFSILPSLMNPVERVIFEMIKRHIAAMGEPWVSDFDPAVLRETLLGLGFTEAETYEPDVLNRRYLYRRKDGLRSGGRLALARR
jgi:methyltransferase (TIGR00027 family)